jgi:uncharacterized protein
MTEFTPISALAGGALIGLAAALLLLASRRVAGVSSITAGVLRFERGDTAWRLAFIVGLVAGVWAYALAGGSLADITIEADWAVLVAGGLLVGIGTRLGGGCTSGHGVCGISRFSGRSIVATVVFMAAAAATVFLVRHVLGGGA